MNASLFQTPANPPPPPLPRRVFITKKVTNLFKPILSVGSTPGGCTKYIQAQDVSWNKPFKAHVTEQYDDWLGNGIHEYAAGGNMKPHPDVELSSGF